MRKASHSFINPGVFIQSISINETFPTSDTGMAADLCGLFCDKTNNYGKLKIYHLLYKYKAFHLCEFSCEHSRYFVWYNLLHRWSTGMASHPCELSCSEANDYAVQRTYCKLCW
ncbi:hypothetical protein AMECASPLE_032323 [Ameca splendens]|uniref:Uncharacterized protein n=1 Tax=Ameca splendens TaxID=208324 RepID=A0ABV0Z4F4_9TELE